MTTLRQAILDALRHGEGERFTLVLDARLDGALTAALSGPRPADELSDVLRLIIALEQSLASPAAAETLRGWLRRSAGAKAVLGQLFGAARGLDASRAFATMTGKAEAPRAGMYGAAAPAGAFSVRRFIDPGAAERTRAAAGRPQSAAGRPQPAARPQSAVSPPPSARRKLA